MRRMQAAWQQVQGAGAPPDGPADIPAECLPTAVPKALAIPTQK